MTLENILWGLAGFVAFLIFQLAKPVRNRSGWDFVVQLAFFGAISFVVSLSTIKAAHHLFPEAAETIKVFWNSHLLPIPGLLAVGILVSAPITGIVTAILWKWLHPLASWLAKQLSGRDRNLEFSDTFFKTTHELLGKLSLMSTKSGKVYVGVLNEVTSDPNESSRYIRISPVMSGYRRKDDFKVVFNTNYVAEMQEGDSTRETLSKIPSRDLLIPAAEVISIAYFDPELHAKFVESNITLVVGYNYEVIESDEISPGSMG